MKTFKLVAKIENLDFDTMWSCLTKIVGDGAQEKCEQELIVDSGYSIERTAHKGFIYYLHYKQSDLVKICVYKELKGND